ncbi:janus kinase and microtubule-interacting protein 1-like [Littorina saxatilis]|uniref:janus kinase and microtubule-interacting protein 1-like n=1 Tax=Littorina saxatilis TaxID=31220 RepID=UPI0038B533DD
MASGSPPKLDRRQSETSADGIKSLNHELREHLTRLRSQLELQRGSDKHFHWQKVLDARAVRQQEQEKAAAALQELRTKHEREKSHELSALRETLVTRYEGELHKLQRHKEAEITKLRMDMDGKDGVIRRLISETRRTSLRSSIDGHKTRLIHELRELRSSKKELEDLLEAATIAQRNHSDELRRQEDSLQAEVARVRRDSQSEIRQLMPEEKPWLIVVVQRLSYGTALDNEHIDCEESVPDVTLT